MKKKKQIFSVIMAVLMSVLSVMSAVGVSAADTGTDNSYKGKTVILYTGNLRGNIDVYAQIAKVKKDYEAKGADVILADAGNYLQGSAYANSDMGLSVYHLMDKAGYDVAAMGRYEFVYGAATTGYPYHSNFYKYYTQKELYEGVGQTEYKSSNREGAAPAIREAKPAAGFKALSSNYQGTGKSGYYAFDANTVITTDSGFRVGVFAVTDEQVSQNVQDGFMDGYTVTDPETETEAQLLALAGQADVTVCLSNAGIASSKADITIHVSTDGEQTVGAYVIDNLTKTVRAEEISLTEADVDKEVQADAEAVKKSAGPVIGKAEVVLNGADRDNRNKETNFGDFITDALKWYAENKMDGVDRTLPVVAIQNGGNCDNYLYTGDITQTDLLHALPFSPMGVGVLKVTGAQLLKVIEVSTQPYAKNGGTNETPNCPGFAQVSGLEYTIDMYKEYDAGAENGNFFEADSVNRVSITSVNGQPFDENAFYLLIADNFLMNGNDGYYLLKDIKTEHPDFYINNQAGVKTRDIAAMYIQEKLGGIIGSQYEKPQGRIIENDAPEYHVEAGSGITYTEGSGEELSVTFSGSLEDFRELRLDGEFVDPADYKKEPGSTMITLPAGYMASLGLGEHTLTAVYTYGEVDASFTVVRAVPEIDGQATEEAGSEKQDSPATGDGRAVQLYVLMALAGLTVLAAGKKTGRLKA